jgi:hypothetical protein
MNLSWIMGLWKVRFQIRTQKTESGAPLKRQEKGGYVQFAKVDSQMLDGTFYICIFLGKQHPWLHVGLVNSNLAKKECCKYTLWRDTTQRMKDIVTGISMATSGLRGLVGYCWIYANSTSRQLWISCVIMSTLMLDSKIATKPSFIQRTCNL